MVKKATVTTKAESRLREFALGFPESYEEFPWGHRAIKVRKKVYVFLSINDDGLHMSSKLPESGEAALNLPFTKPTGYGLGKSGWVSSSFTPGERPPIEMLCDWIEESYRAIAPKKLVARL